MESNSARCRFSLSATQYIMTPFKLFLACSAFALSATLSAGCGGSTEDARGDKTATAADDGTGLAALMQRKGTLAASEEWARVQAKDAELRDRIRRNPDDIKARIQLVTIFITEARITGEHPYYYPATLKMLDVVLGKDPRNFEAMVYKASVLMSQHQFAQAREVGLKARDINPANAYVYGVLVDANVELGQYEDAVRMSDSMQALKPSLESYSRASYLREIYGDYPGSIQAMKMAVDAGLPGSEPQSWSRSTLAYLYEKTGDLDRAEGEYRTILEMRPSYAFAMRGLARVSALRNEPDTAMRLLKQAADIMPEFSFYEEMGDIQAARGDKAAADKTYREVITMLGEDAASGHTVNLELCRVFTKMGALDSAAVYGMKEYAVRPQNIDVNNALAWIAHKRGDAAKAAEHLAVALRTGSKDPELLWRASEIERAAGNTAKSASMLAQARKVNPGFDPADFQ